MTAIITMLTSRDLPKELEITMRGVLDYAFSQYGFTFPQKALAAFFSFSFT
jgi:hypothetical protein